MKLILPSRCDFCGASVEDEPAAAIKAMQSCNNCRVDIGLQGHWTGIGWLIFKAMKAKYQAAKER